MVNKLKVILVDDVQSARDDLKDILKRRHSDIEVVGEAENTLKAWEMIQQGSPIDGVFLDIDIPTESERAGLDFAFNLNRLAHPPWVVFVSGVSCHALEAYRLHPAHYLLKPLDDAAVDETMAWIRKHYKPQKIAHSLIAIKHKNKNNDGNSVFCTAFVYLDEIVYIQKNNNTASLKIKLIQGDLLDGISGVLGDWLKHGFKQIHKSSLVNMEQVRGLRPRISEENAYKIYFRCCEDEIPVGATYQELLRSDF